MSIFVSATPAPKPKSKDVTRMSIFYAGLLTVMAVAQLFTFEEFLELFESLELPGAETTGYLLASLIVVTEIFAIPFLLRMSLSPAFRWLSMLSGFFAAGLWLFTTCWMIFSGVEVETVGFLGTVVDMMPGLWAAFMSIAFGVLSAWAAWGMWPGPLVKKKRH